MEFVEELTWILDDDNYGMGNEEGYRINREFVHSLGLKCDVVGWSRLDLQSPRADEILLAIDSFCKANGWKARGVYTRKYTNYTGDWYELAPTAFKDNTLCNIEEYESEQGKTVKVCNLRAYHEPRPSPKWFGKSVLVPERFRDACIRHGITDLDFCWARDKGKYQAEQYFHIYCNRQIPTIAVDRGISIHTKDRLKALGGYLPKIADIFYNLQQISLQDCYIRSDIPDSNIAVAYSRETIFYSGKNKILLHKSFADLLLREKAISASDLHPAMVVEAPPLGYTLDTTDQLDKPIASRMRQSISEYERLKATARPIHLVSEKEALKLLKAAKKERKADFGRPLPKAKAAETEETAYAPVVPYYLVANGGCLSDEYKLLPLDQAILQNGLLAKSLLAEELMENSPNGVVFAQCADGDNVLLCSDGRVIRFSHEKPATVEEWGSLAQFIADSING